MHGQMSQLLQSVRRTVDHAKAEVHDRAQEWAEEHNVATKYVDITVHFIGANGIPKMDVVGTADPYFVAKLDGNLSFVFVVFSLFVHLDLLIDTYAAMVAFFRSTVKPNTLTPVWNELWSIKNVPSSATLQVQVLDKDDGSITDDYIGSFETSVSAGAKELTIEGATLRRSRGTFWLKVLSLLIHDNRRAS